MSTEPHLFKLLTREWNASATGPDARDAAAMWARSHAVLAGLATPAEVVEQCQLRSDPARSAALLRAALAEAGGSPWAARTVLQAVLPGLSAVIRRAMPLVGPDRVWQSHDELDQHVVSIAYERIHTLAADPPEWPANAIVDGTWQRLRTVMGAERKRATYQCSLEEAPDRPTLAVRSSSEDLVEVVARAVELGILERSDAWLVYASRIEAQPMEALGSQFGHGARWAWRRRKHAENVLKESRPMLVAAAL